MKGEIEILITRYFDNSISVEEMDVLTTWINQSDEHRRKFDQIRKIRQLTHPAFSSNDINLEAAEEAILKKIRKNEKDVYKSVAMWWQKIAAVLFIPALLFSGYLWLNSQKKNTYSNCKQEITAMPGTRTKVYLPDGSQAWLNSGSTLIYPLAFEKNERNVTLIGEGYFKVQADRKTPFFILANELKVMVTGTELNVESYRGDSINSVVLASGKATVITGDEQQIPLKPNQCLSLNARTKKLELHSIDASLYGSWKDGVLAFRDETLEKVFQRISRTFNVEIQVKDATLARHEYRATFEEESLQQILDLITLSAPIQYKYVKNTHNGITKEIIEVYSK